MSLTGGSLASALNIRRGEVVFGSSRLHRSLLAAARHSAACHRSPGLSDDLPWTLASY